MATTDGDQRGVYYDSHGYASLVRRVSIEAIDILVVILLTFVISITAGTILLPISASATDDATSQRALGRVFIITFVVVSILYFVVLKASRFRTLGYKLTGADIVTLEGTNPSLLIHAYRFLFIVLGPLNIALDLFWLGGDKNRQAIRDKFAKTYVIRRGARPAGTGKIVFAPYNFLGSSFIFREVARDESSAR